MIPFPDYHLYIAFHHRTLPRWEHINIKKILTLNYYYYLQIHGQFLKEAVGANSDINDVEATISKANF